MALALLGIGGLGAMGAAAELVLCFISLILQVEALFVY